MRKSLLTGVVVATTLFSANSFAQGVTQIVPEGEIEGAVTEELTGSKVDGFLRIGANVNLASNSNVVGQVDGFSTLFGLNLQGGLDYLWGRHAIRNTLSINESWAKTPVIDEFIKNADNVSLESMYNYFLLDWAGAYGRFNIDTSLLASEAVTSEETEYSITQLDGTTRSVTTDRLRMADGFEPLTLAESIGVFLEPTNSPAFSTSIRLGFGARQTFAEGVLANNGETDNVVNIIELDDVIQGGLEAFAGFRGRAQNSRVNYELGVAALMPFFNNDDTDRSALDLTRIALAGQVSTNVFTWAALSYQLRVTSDPQLLDDVQVQNALLLTFQYTLVDRDPGLPSVTTEQLLEASQKQAAEAEERAAAAEAAAAKALEEQEALRQEQQQLQQELQRRIQEPAEPAEPAEPTEAPAQ